MTYTLEKMDDNNLRFLFRFSSEEYLEAQKEYAEKNKKQYLEAIRSQGSFRRPVITELVRKAYVKAAMEYPQEIYYSPTLSLDQDDENGIVCSARVQIAPVFKLGNYRALQLSEQEIRQIEQETATVPELNRAGTRRYLLQAAMVIQLDKICEGEIPDPMAGERASQMLSAFEQQLDLNGQKLEDYYKDCNTNEKELFLDFSKEAKKQLHSRLALYELAKAEGLLATEEEYEEELSRLSERSMMPVSRLREIFAQREGTQVRQDIAIAKAAEYLGDMAERLYPPKG